MVGKFDPDPDGAGRGIEMRINQRDLSGERPVRIAPHSHNCGLVLGYVGQVAFCNVDQYPNGAVVGDTEKDIAGPGTHAVAYVSFEYNPVAGRLPSEGDRHLPRLLDVSEHALGHGIVHQPLARTGRSGCAS